jgi:hypothetical protein
MRRILTSTLLLIWIAPAGAAGPLQRVRTVDEVLARLLLEGRTRSPTFARLVETIEQTEWLVFVQAGSCPDRVTVGCLIHVVGGFQGRRYLRVVVKVGSRHPDQVIVTLAHELQHAVEVVADANVIDTATLLAHTRRVSTLRFTTPRAAIYETTAAWHVELAVFRELRKR